MKNWFERKFYNTQVRALIYFKPATLFDKINNLAWYKKTLRQWIDEQKFSRGNSILDMGCATGVLSRYLDQCGYKTTGADFSTNMISTAKSNKSNVDFRIANAEDLPFSESEFDAIISASLINIVSDKQKVIHEMSRICKPGGRISVLVPKQDFSHRNLQDLTRSIGATRFSAAALRAWHRNAPKMQPLEIESLLLNANLTPEPPVEYLQGLVFSVTARKNS